MKYLKYYIYQLLQRIKNSKKLIFLFFLILFLLLAIYFYKSFLKLGPKYYFLVINIDTLISSDELDIDSLIREIKDPKYYGIVLKIASGGGGIEVLRIIDSLKEVNKTKICYIDGLATSAAYWICSLSDYIIARADSTVGNIGAYITIMDISNFLKKLGINVTIIKSTPYKDIGSSYRELSDFERQYLQNVLKNLTERFIEDLKSKRGELEDIAISGLWFLAEDAKRYNLIDEIGEFERVKSYIVEKFNISEDSIVFEFRSFRKRRGSLLDIFFNLFNRLLHDPTIEKIFI